MKGKAKYREVLLRRLASEAPLPVALFLSAKKEAGEIKLRVHGVSGTNVRMVHLTIGHGASELRFEHELSTRFPSKKLVTQLMLLAG